MTDYLVLTEFVPGTKAKAQEVNANFSAVKDAINAKASASGDSTKTFSVANATDTKHAVNKEQLDSLSNDVSQKINGTSARFCAKSGNVTNGNADLLSYSGMNVTVKVGGAYPNLVASNYKGEFGTISSIPTINMTGKPNGAYNVFTKLSGEVYTQINSIYKQITRPTMVDGDIWLNTSVEPIKATKYSATSDVEFLDVPIGKITIAGGVITGVETYQYNQNGYDMNTQTTKKYDSGWFSVGIGATYTKTHNLCTDKIKVTILFSSNSDGSVFNWIVPVAVHNASSSCSAGCVVANVYSTTLEVRTGQTDVAGQNPYPNDDGYYWGGTRQFSTRRTSGYYRVIAEAM